MEPVRVRLKCRYEGETRTVVISNDASLLQLRKRLSADYGFEMQLRYEDKEGDLITLASQDDFDTLMQTLVASQQGDDVFHVRRDRALGRPLQPSFRDLGVYLLEQLLV